MDNAAADTNMGVVHFVVWSTMLDDETTAHVELHIPIQDIRRIAHKPMKWLHYVAWAITGVSGQIYLETGLLVDENAVLLSAGQRYLFVGEGECFLFYQDEVSDSTKLQCVLLWMCT
jgi:hypothetical protein